MPTQHLAQSLRHSALNQCQLAWSVTSPPPGPGLSQRARAKPLHPQLQLCALLDGISLHHVPGSNSAICHLHVSEPGTHTPTDCRRNHFQRVKVQEIVKCFPLLYQWTSSEIADSIQSKLVTREQFSCSVQHGELCFALFLLEGIHGIFPRGKLSSSSSFASLFV